MAPIALTGAALACHVWVQVEYSGYGWKGGGEEGLGGGASMRVGASVV